MADELVKRLRNPTYYTHPTTEDGRLAADRIEQLVATNKQLTTERDRLREALAIIDAIDPEHHIDGCALTVVRGLVLRMGETARAALKGATP